MLSDGEGQRSRARGEGGGGGGDKVRSEVGQRPAMQGPAEHSQATVLQVQ